ncbi:MAG: hypothetical protein HYX47_01630 [Burkholderiales bacterium]|nr:hypothetical protein [Burkholderiales bacterium]
MSSGRDDCDNDRDNDRRDNDRDDDRDCDGHSGSSSRNHTAVMSGDTRGDVTEDNASKKVARGDIDVCDSDRGESGVKAITNKAGTYGTFSIDAAGNWVYTLDNTKAATQALGASQTATDSFVVYSTDGSASKTVSVSVHGAAEAQSSPGGIGGTATGTVKEDATPNTTAGHLTVNGSNVTSGFTAVTKAGTYGTFKLDVAGNWTYALDNSKAVVQALNEGQSVTESFTATATTGNCNTVSKVITVTVQGTAEGPIASPPVIGGADLGTVTEGATPDTTLGQLTLNGVNVATGFTALTKAGTYGTFSLDAAGHWSFLLDNSKANVQALIDGQSVSETFAITTTTASGGVVSHNVVITVLGTNDAVVIGGATTGQLKEDTTTSASGQLTINDPDANQSTLVAQTGTATGHGTFSVTTAGAWTFALNNAMPDIQALKSGETLVERVTVISADGSAGQIFLNIAGTNDAPVAANDTASFRLGTGNVLPVQAISVLGNDTDLDHSAVLHVAGVAATSAMGARLVVNADNTVSYDVSTSTAILNSAAGAVLHDSFAYQAVDEFGAVSAATVAITLTGFVDE